MRIVAQRSSFASVSVEGETVGVLDSPGLVLLVGITGEDSAQVAEKMAAKIWGLRILEGTGGSDPEAWSKGDVSCSDVGAPLLVISQFTLYGDTRKGRRPSWDAAAPAEIAEPLFDHFVDTLRGLGAHVETGVFGAQMEVSLTNTGPVTLILEM
ncbi:MAG: D-aminoacyl-tRNA deacylase [Propionibacteriaceae bacterium]|nr:D-aminoacyl-tRNA deacylase [Propionibacteriaceae bacterium]